MIVRRRFLLSLALSALALRGYARDQEASAGRHSGTIKVSGTDRSYILRVPSGHDGKRPLPLVLMMHGRGGSGAQAELSYGFAELAEKENFIVCFPNALPDRQGIPTWNAGYNAGREGADDVAFLEALLQHLKATLNIDSERIYACGHSSGAMMSYKFGAEKSNELAAIGVVAGSIGSTIMGRTTMVSKPSSPLPVISFHGKADSIVPYDWKNGIQSSRFLMKFIPAPESVRFFADADGCDKTPKREESFGGNIIKETFSGGRNGSEVVFYTIVDGTHMWPGGRGRRFAGAEGQANQQINATKLIWEFFKDHPRA